MIYQTFQGFATATHDLDFNGNLNSHLQSDFLIDPVDFAPAKIQFWSVNGHDMSGNQDHMYAQNLILFHANGNNTRQEQALSIQMIADNGSGGGNWDGGKTGFTVCADKRPGSGPVWGQAIDIDVRAGGDLGTVYGLEIDINNSNQNYGIADGKMSALVIGGHMEYTGTVAMWVSYDGNSPSKGWYIGQWFQGSNLIQDYTILDETNSNVGFAVIGNKSTAAIDLRQATGGPALWLREQQPIDLGHGWRVFTWGNERLLFQKDGVVVMSVDPQGVVRAPGGFRTEPAN